jgi:Ca2+-binding RTX toxin-like protein
VLNQASGAQGTDFLVGIENIRTGGGHDLLIGDDGANRLEGGAGDDILQGLLGADVLDGGAGTDNANYFDNAGVVVRLDLGTAQDGGGSTDTLLRIEDVTGSNFDDRITGNAGANVLRGVGGLDRMSGGAGDDWLLGEVGNDVLAGEAGNDVLLGDAGADRLTGGLGNDGVGGGAGADVFAFLGGFGQDEVLDFQNGVDRFDLDAGLSFAALSITLVDADTDGAQDDVRVGVGASGFDVLNTTRTAIDAADFLF